jgi:hypothetical protein
MFDTAMEHFCNSFNSHSVRKNILANNMNAKAQDKARALSSFPAMRAERFGHTFNVCIGTYAFGQEKISRFGANLLLTTVCLLALGAS